MEHANHTRDPNLPECDILQEYSYVTFQHLGQEIIRCVKGKEVRLLDLQEFLRFPYEYSL